MYMYWFLLVSSIVVVVVVKQWHIYRHSKLLVSSTMSASCLNETHSKFMTLPNRKETIAISDGICLIEMH